MSQSLFVARGRTVSIDGRTYAPGEIAPIADADIDRMKLLGFAQDTPPILAVPTDANPSGVGVQGFVQGPNFRQ